MKASSLFMALLFVIADGSASGALKGLDYMVAGKAVIEIADTWQITHSADGKVVEAAVSPDGRQVAFLVERGEGCERNLCLVSSTGGSVTTVMKSDGEPPVYKGKPETAWNLAYRPVWSADCRFIFLTARVVSETESGRVEQGALIVLSSKGEYVAHIPAGEKIHLTGEPIVSPDGVHVVTPAHNPDYQSGQANPWGVVVFEIAGGTSRYLSCGATWISPIWSADGTAVWFSSYERERGDGQSKPVIKELNVQTGESRVVEWLTQRQTYLSPDGLLRACEKGPVISVTNVKTGASADVIKCKHINGVFWAPNSRMFLYREAGKITDHAGVRSDEATRLWLAGIETHKLNTICLALGVDDEILPTWSSDSLKVAYVSKGRLHVVALRKRAPTPQEKAHAGLPLTEQDQQKLAVQDLKAIGLAVLMHTADTEGDWPGDDSIEQCLEDYVGDRDIIFRPNTSQGYFRYFRENLVGVRKEDRCRTVMAEFDFGYSWKAVVYADGHVKIVSK